MTRLAEGKSVIRDLAIKVQDSGGRELTVTLRGDGWMYLRAKGLRHQVAWKVDALYDMGIKQGRLV